MSYTGPEDGTSDTNYGEYKCGDDRGDFTLPQSHSPQGSRRRETVQPVHQPTLSRIYPKDYRDNDQTGGRIQGVQRWIKMTKSWFERKLEESKQRRAEKSRIKTDAEADKTRAEFDKAHQNLDFTLDIVIKNLNKRKRG